MGATETFNCQQFTLLSNKIADSFMFYLEKKQKIAYKTQNKRNNNIMLFLCRICASAWIN